MATARELLAQADALMRRNRLRDAGRAAAAAQSGEVAAAIPVPVLTEVIETDALPQPPASGGANIDIENAIDLAELETEAAVAAATEAAIAKEIAAAAQAAGATDDVATADAEDSISATETRASAAALAAFDAPDSISAMALHAMGSPREASPADAVTRDRSMAADAATDDVPLLTDVVDDFDTAPILDPAEAGLDVFEWTDTDGQDAVNAGAATVGPQVLPADATALPPVAVTPEIAAALEPPAATAAAAFTAGAAGLLGVAAVAVAAQSEAAKPAASPAAHPAGASAEQAVGAADRAHDAAHWNALAEEIRMQVLQRLDIFTDTGLQEQLTARLQPIVDRASADLVATINQQIGQLLRAHVSEAIEREIDRWREGGP